MYILEDGTELTEEIRQAFKRGLTRAYIKYDDVTIDQNNFLMNAKYKDEKADPESGQFIGVTSMRELTIKLNNLDNSLDLENKDIEYHLGAKVGNEYKYINFGNFIVQKPENQEVNEETTFTALDYMCKFDTDEPYESELVFPTTLGDLAEDVCRQVGVELGNKNFRNADKQILANPFLNGENPRTVLKSIAKLSFSCGYIGQDNKLYFSFNWYENNIVEEITTDGYFENKPNNEVKPISVITLRSSEIKTSGQSIYDDDLIDQYGTNELILEEDYIAYTDTLRNTYLEAARELFGLTYKPLSIDLLGSVYLSFNDAIKVINPQGQEYRTFALNNTHEYNGTLYNSISVPALTEVEEKYKYETEDKTFRRKTAVEIDKANQQIQAIVSEIGDRSEKQTTITQDLDRIELKISDIEDLTLEVTGNNPLMLENCMKGALLQFRIKGNNTVFSGLVPSDTLVPSNELVPSGVNAAIELSVEGENEIVDIVETYTGKVAFNYYGQMISNDNVSASNVSYYIEVKPKTKYTLRLIDNNVNTKFYISLWGENFFEKLEECNSTPSGSQLFLSPKRFFSNWTEGGAGWDYSIKEYIIETGDEEYYIVLKSWGTSYTDLENIIITDKRTLPLDIKQPLRQLNAAIYDEYVYDYESDIISKVIRRVGVTANGTLYQLASEVVEEIPIENIILEEGTNYINIISPYIANCYARYVQLNDFTKQFATTYQVESAITQLANSITLLVREKVNKEEVIAELNLEIAEGKGIVRITGNQVIIDSDYFHLLADGTITATTGYIAGLEMWRHMLSNGMTSALTKTYTTTDTSRDSEGKYVSGLLIPENTYGIDFIVADMPYNGGAWDTSTASLRILHNGNIYCKRINMNGESGYTRINFDSGKIAMNLLSNGLEFRLDDNTNTLFGKFTRESSDLTISILGALGFCIRDTLHSRNLYNVDPRQGQVPYHYFTGEMWMDRDLDGTFVQVAQNGDWSDERLKENIKDSETNALEIIDKIRFKQFTWNETSQKAGTHIDIGLIAQDIEKINKNYVEINPRIYNGKRQDLLSIDVLNLLTTTTKAVQELNQKVKDLEEEIKRLKGEN